MAKATDVELAGDVLRVATSGLPDLASCNAHEALTELRTKYEPFRDFLNLPPNGNHLINSCLLYPPFQQGADGTLFLASRFAYAPYAGTALMAAAAVLGETQSYELANDHRLVPLLTARGLMSVELNWTGKAVTHAKWFTIPPRVLVSQAKLLLFANTTVPISLVDAGLPYLVVDSGKMGLSLSDHSCLSRAAIDLSAACAEQFPLHKFGNAESYDNYLVMFSSEVTKNHIKTVWVSDKGEVANSAGGTGALSVLAAYENSGHGNPGKPTCIEAPGGTFECQISGNKASVASEVKIIAKHEFRLGGHVLS
jgi:proline racemase